MRACVVRSIKPQATRSCLTKNAAVFIASRQISQLVRPTSAAPKHLTHKSRTVTLFGNTQVRSYATEADVEILKVPFLADSISQGEVAKIMKKVGDSVKTDETIMSLDTDKTSAEINSPYPAEIVEVLTKEGDTVVVGQPLVKIKKSSGAPAAKSGDAKTEAKSEPKSGSIQEVKSDAKPAEKQASEKSAKQDDKPAPSSSSQSPTNQKPATSSPAPSPKSVSTPSKPSAGRTETSEKMTKIRQRTSVRLKESQNTNASLTTTNEIDMTNITELRNTHGDAFLKKHGAKLGFMSVFVRAAVAALQDQPIVNASISGDNIVYKSYNDISVAVATERGLVVPVLRDCQAKSMAEIEKELAALGARARLNQVSIEEMTGGTFTISNGGVYGSMFGTPIINPPQSAILGMHGIFKRAVVINDQIVIRPMMYIALTYDHRLIDGREAVTFLRKIKDIVEDPRRLLLDI